MALCLTTALREPWNYGLRGWISTRSNDLARVLSQQPLQVLSRGTSQVPPVGRLLRRGIVRRFHLSGGNALGTLSKGARAA